MLAYLAKRDCCVINKVEETLTERGMDKRPCLYVSGITETVADGCAHLQSPNVQAFIEYLVKNDAALQRGQVLSLPEGWDIDVVQLTLSRLFPENIADSMTGFLQRNRKSGKVRLVIAFPSALAPVIAEALPRIVNSRTLYGGLGRLGVSNAQAPQVRANILYDVTRA